MAQKLQCTSRGVDVLTGRQEKKPRGTDSWKKWARKPEFSADVKEEFK